MLILGLGLGHAMLRHSVGVGLGVMRVRHTIPYVCLRCISRMVNYVALVALLSSPFIHAADVEKTGFIAVVCVRSIMDALDGNVYAAFGSLG